MNTYFKQSNIMKRFFFILGNTKDTFVDEALFACDLEYLLFEHLKSIGYERILFYGKTQKIFCYDKQSYSLVFKSEKISGASKKKTPILVQGPLGGRIKIPEKGSNASNIPKDKLHFGKMNDLDAFKRIDYCMRNKSVKTAVLINNAEDFMHFFGEVRTNRGGESIRSNIYDSINSYGGLGYENNNIMIFIFPQRSMCETISVYENSGGMWDLFMKPKMAQGNVIEISYPLQSEVRNAINLIRIKHGLQIDMLKMNDICKMIARRAYSSKVTLTAIMHQFLALAKSNRKLNIDTAKEMCNISNEQSAIERLDGLIGMTSVKKQIRTFIQRARRQEEPGGECFTSRILPTQKTSGTKANLNYILTGNPGTGKTTAAKLLGEIFYELGLLPGGHTVKVTRSDLVAGYVGQTAIKTRGCIDKAMGGVLFIDEAYMLKRNNEEAGIDDDFGQEAIDTILEAISDRAGEFAVIAAGYPREMEGFLNSNPGLYRRFNGIINIEDYSPEELIEIFYLNCRNRGFASDKKLDEKLAKFFNNWFKSRDKNWGNAGNVEKLIEKMYDNWCVREGYYDSEGQVVLTLEDIPDNLQIHLKELSEAKQDAIERLDSLVGLDNVKTRIKKIRRNILIGGITSAPGHYVFSGNPGTGKTTVAKLLGDLLCEAGVLRRGHVIEVGREDLVGIHVGSTAQKTKAIIEKALDGVLFIDEAYRLVDGQDGSNNSFGREAIDTLVASMENYRERLCIICAGYTKHMEMFVRSNPGLSSRFTDIIEFEDYNQNELVEIFKGFAGEQYTLEDEFLNDSRKIFNLWLEEKKQEFGNARSVRKYFEQCRDTLYERLETEYGIEEIPANEKYIFTNNDIPQIYWNYLLKN